MILTELVMCNLREQAGVLYNYVNVDKYLVRATPPFKYSLMHESMMQIFDDACILDVCIQNARFDDACIHISAMYV